MRNDVGLRSADDVLLARSHLWPVSVKGVLLERSLSCSLTFDLTVLTLWWQSWIFAKKPAWTPKPKNASFALQRKVVGPEVDDISWENIKKTNCLKVSICAGICGLVRNRRGDVRVWFVLRKCRYLHWLLSGPSEVLCPLHVKSRGRGGPWQREASTLQDACPSDSPSILNTQSWPSSHLPRRWLNVLPWHWAIFRFRLAIPP